MGLGHSPSIVVDGLVFYIDPNNTNCYSGSGNTIYNLVNPSIGGTFVGYTSNPIDNTENRTVFFDGSNDYVDFGSSSLFKLTDNFTLSCWVKSSVYGDRAILGNFGPSSNYSGFNLNIQPSNKFAFLTGSQPNATYLYADSTFSLNTWYHVTGLRRSGTNYLYINGVLQTGSNTQVVASSAQNFYLAKWYSNLTDYYHYGNIGIVSLYNKALSSDEILQNFNATKKKYDPDENIVTNGLVLHIDPSKNTSYPGTGNTIYDLSGSGNTGTLVSSPTFSSLNSGSLVFNGNSYITRSSALNTGQNFSVTAWIYPTSLSGGGRNAIIGNGYPFSTDNGWFFCISNNNFGTFQSLMISLGQDNCIKISNSYVFQLNKWTHVAVTVSGGGSVIKLYANGIETSYGFSGGSARTLTYSTNEFHVGMRHSGTPERFGGNISGVQIYNKVLSAQEIQQNYNATKNRFVNALPPVRKGLVLELDAGQRSSYSGAGNTWYDLSGNSLNGTLTNGPTFSGIGATSTILTDGSNDYIISDVNKTVIGSNLTITFLLSMTSTSGGLLEISDSLGTGMPWIYLKRQSSSQIYWYLDGDYRFLVDLSTNEFAYITLTYTNNVWTSYKNGSAIGTASIGVGTYGGNNLRLGVGYHGYTTTKWNLFTIYNRALSAYEIKQNFDYYRTRYNI